MSNAVFGFHGNQHSIEGVPARFSPLFLERYGTKTHVSPQAMRTRILL